MSFARIRELAETGIVEQVVGQSDLFAGPLKLAKVPK